MFFVLDAPKKRTEEEELEVYGYGSKTSVQLTNFTFEVCDSIMNIGPIGFMTPGVRTTELENPEEEGELKRESLQIDVELLASSGCGKNGALCVLQNAIRPQIITSFDLSGAFLGAIYISFISIIIVF